VQGDGRTPSIEQKGYGGNPKTGEFKLVAIAGSVCKDDWLEVGAAALLWLVVCREAINLLPVCRATIAALISHTRSVKLRTRKLMLGNRNRLNYA
jgi:hypothetical protein